MGEPRIMLDCFSGGIAELKRGQRTIPNALRALSADPRVSVWERGTGWLESLLADMQTAGLIVEDKAEPYPWCRFNLTDSGRAAIAQTSAGEQSPAGAQG